MSFFSAIGNGLKKVAHVALPFAESLPVVGGAVKAGEALFGNHGDNTPQVTQGGRPISLSDINPNVPQGTGMPGQDSGGLMGGLKKVGSFLGAHGDQILGGAALGEGLMNQRKANNLQGQALGIANQSYNDRAGLRKLGVSQMMDQTAPDLSGVFAQPSNPYSKMRKVS